MLKIIISAILMFSIYDWIISMILKISIPLALGSALIPIVIILSGIEIAKIYPVLAMLVIFVGFPLEYQTNYTQTKIGKHIFQVKKLKQIVRKEI